MKLLTLFLTVVLLQVSANTSAQQVNYSVKEGKLKDAFESLEKQTGMVFFYKSDVLAAAKAVSVDLKNTPIEKALDLLLKDQPLEYTIEGNTVFIKPKKKQLAAILPTITETLIATTDVHGTVKDESGKPAVGVAVKVKGTNKGTTTNDNGEFTLTGVDPNATLVFSSVNMETYETKLNGRNDVALVMKAKVSKLEDVEITAVNTGYQTISKERATGSFVKIDNELLNRRVSTNIIDRLEGISSGLAFYRDSKTNQPTINIRGRNTIFANTAPLIVVDNFPYDGDIANINPNDVESVTIMKDAAAASIWGVRAGNGVIVITMKKGRENQSPRVEFNSNITSTARPDMFYVSRISPSDFIDAEKLFFSRGLYKTIEGLASKTALSPAVELLIQKRDGLLSAAQADTQIEALKNYDARDDFNRYFLRTGLNQQYSLNISGGGINSAYYLSFGYDHNQFPEQRNSYERYSLNTSYSMSLAKDLDFSSSLSMAQTGTANNNPGINNFTNLQAKRFFPYARFADALKVKHWADAGLEDLIGNLSALKSRLVISQRVYFIDGDANPVGEVYRFLLNQWMQKKMQAKKRAQADEENETDVAPQTRHAVNILVPKRKEPG